VTLRALVESTDALFDTNPWEPAACTRTLVADALKSEPVAMAGPLADGESELEPPQVVEQLLEGAAQSWELALLATWRHLRWFGSSRSGGSAYSQLVGPGSPWPRDDVRVGVFLVKENYTYPAHVHGADEIYMLVGGEGMWAIAEEPFTPYRPGDAINIPSMTPHAIRTHDTPALTIYSWTGDVTFDRYSFVD